MTWPTSDIDTTDFDSDTDSPASAQNAIYGMLTALNQMRSHVTSLNQALLELTDVASMRTLLTITVPTSYIRSCSTIYTTPVQADVSNSSTETIVFSHFVLSNLLGTTRGLRFVTHLDARNSGPLHGYITTRLYVNSTIIHTLVDTVSATGQTMMLDLDSYISAANSTGAQFARTEIFDPGNKTVQTSGFLSTFISSTRLTCTNSLAVDTTTSFRVALSAQLSYANANFLARFYVGTLEVT